MTPPSVGRALRPESDSPSIVRHPRVIVRGCQRAAIADARDQPSVKDSREHRFLVLVRAHECAPGDRTSELRKRWCARTKRKAKTSRSTRGGAKQRRSERESSQETKHPRQPRDVVDVVRELPRRADERSDRGVEERDARRAVDNHSRTVRRGRVRPNVTQPTERAQTSHNGKERAQAAAPHRPKGTASQRSTGG
jgi:hypothetical protein